MLASPALVAGERDCRAVQELVAETDLTIEANDVGALSWRCRCAELAMSVR